MKLLKIEHKYIKFFYINGGKKEFKRKIIISTRSMGVHWNDGKKIAAKITITQLRRRHYDSLMYISCINGDTQKIIKQQ